MTRLLGKPKEIKTKCNIDGTPLSFMRNGKVEKIKSIYQHWRVADEWWREEIARDCFTIRTSSGLVCDIYRDMKTNRWYLSRIHD